MDCFLSLLTWRAPDNQRIIMLSCGLDAVLANLIPLWFFSARSIPFPAQRNNRRSEYVLRNVVLFLEIDRRNSAKSNSKSLMLSTKKIRSFPPVYQPHLLGILSTWQPLFLTEDWFLHLIKDPCNILLNKLAPERLCLTPQTWLYGVNPGAFGMVVHIRYPQFSWPSTFSRSVKVVAIPVCSLL